MSAHGPSQPPIDGQQGQAGSSSQPLAPPLRAPSRDNSLTRDGGSSRRAGSSRGGQNVDATGSTPAATALSGSETANETSNDAQDKNNLTSRVRAPSTGSKRSAQQNEKTGRPASPSRATQTGGQPAKKKKGFFSFLNCCAAPDEGQEPGSPESTQPAKSSTSRLQPTRSRPPQQSGPQAQNISATNTSTEDSKEVIDEKAGHTQPGVAEPILPSPPDTETMPRTPIENEPPVNSSTNPDIRPLEAGQAMQPAPPGTAPVNFDNSANTSHNPSTTPQVNIQAPTPIVTTPASEDEIIADRTPEQQQRDTDIEMTDAGPSIPLSTNDVAPVPEDETQHSERRDSESSSRVDLPPPPPLDQRQAQVGASALAVAAAGAGAGAVAASHDTSISSSPDQNQKWLLPPLSQEMRGRKCLVLDLDETLVHSSFKMLHQADLTIPVEIEGQYHNVYVIKRPGVDAFLKRVGEIYEVVVFTASVSKYGDPLLDQLDISHSIHHRLFRESCYNHQGNYVKDLSQVGRRLEETIIIDNSPTSYIFHPQHAVPISSWFSDAHDNELLDLIPVLEDLAGDAVKDVSLVLDVAL